MQTDAAAGAAGTLAVAGALFRDAPGEGLSRLAVFFKGLSPTACGYFAQGAAKFGGYEILKQHALTKIRESGGEELVKKTRLVVMITSAAAAEFGATALLAPLEVLKLRIQTDPTSSARGMLRTLAHIGRHEGIGTLYKGFTPIAMRQLPYTITKMVAYELLKPFAKRAFNNTEILKPYTPVLAGLCAGALAAITSHPADLLLTRLCGAPTADVATNVAECVIAEGLFESLAYLKSLGLRGAFSGLGPRLMMISAMTSCQFTFYEKAREVLGVPEYNPPGSLSTAAASG
jgi:solute carrier family 25 phosphate transporter 3